MSTCSNHPSNPSPTGEDEDDCDEGDGSSNDADCAGDERGLPKQKTEAGKADDGGSAQDAVARTLLHALSDTLDIRSELNLTPFSSPISQRNMVSIMRCVLARRMQGRVYAASVPAFHPAAGMPRGLPPPAHARLCVYHPLEVSVLTLSRAIWDMMCPPSSSAMADFPGMGRRLTFEEMVSSYGTEADMACLRGIATAVPCPVDASSFLQGAAVDASPHFARIHEDIVQGIHAIRSDLDVTLGSRHNFILTGRLSDVSWVLFLAKSSNFRISHIYAVLLWWQWIRDTQPQWVQAALDAAELDSLDPAQITEQFTTQLVPPFLQQGSIPAGATCFYPLPSVVARLLERMVSACNWDAPTFQAMAGVGLASPQHEIPEYVRFCTSVLNVSSVNEVLCKCSTVSSPLVFDINDSRHISYSMTKLMRSMVHEFVRSNWRLLISVLNIHGAVLSRIAEVRMPTDSGSMPVPVPLDMEPPRPCERPPLDTTVGLPRTAYAARTDVLCAVAEYLDDPSKCAPEAREKQRFADSERCALAYLDRIVHILLCFADREPTTASNTNEMAMPDGTFASSSSSSSGSVDDMDTEVLDTDFIFFLDNAPREVHDVGVWARRMASDGREKLEYVPVIEVANWIWHVLHAVVMFTMWVVRPPVMPPLWRETVDVAPARVLTPTGSPWVVRPVAMMEPTVAVGGMTLLPVPPAPPGRGWTRMQLEHLWWHPQTFASPTETAIRACGTKARRDAARMITSVLNASTDDDPDRLMEALCRDPDGMRGWLALYTELKDPVYGPAFFAAQQPSSARLLQAMMRGCEQRILQRTIGYGLPAASSAPLLIEDASTRTDAAAAAVATPAVVVASDVHPASAVAMVPLTKMARFLIACIDVSKKSRKEISECMLEVTRRCSSEGPDVSVMAITTSDKSARRRAWDGHWTAANEVAGVFHEVITHFNQQLPSRRGVSVVEATEEDVNSARAAVQCMMSVLEAAADVCKLKGGVGRGYVYPPDPGMGGRSVLLLASLICLNRLSASDFPLRWKGEDAEWRRLAISISSGEDGKTDPSEMAPVADVWTAPVVGVHISCPPPFRDAMDIASPRSVPDSQPAFDFPGLGGSLFQDDCGFPSFGQQIAVPEEPSGYDSLCAALHGPTGMEAF